MTVGNHTHPNMHNEAPQHARDGHPALCACATGRAGGGHTRGSPLACALPAGPAQWQRSLLRGGGKKALPRLRPFLSPPLCPRERTSQARVPRRRRRPSKRAVRPPPSAGVVASGPPASVRRRPRGLGEITRGGGVGRENGGHVLSRPAPGPGLAEGRAGLRRTPGRQCRVAALFRETGAVAAQGGSVCRAAACGPRAGTARGAGPRGPRAVI